MYMYMYMYMYTYMYTCMYKYVHLHVHMPPFQFQTTFVNYLLKSADQLGLDVNTTDEEGNNALVYAVINGNYVIFQTLINAGITSCVVAR